MEAVRSQSRTGLERLSELLYVLVAKSEVLDKEKKENKEHSHHHCEPDDGREDDDEKVRKTAAAAAGTDLRPAEGSMVHHVLSLLCDTLLPLCTTGPGSGKGNQSGHDAGLTGSSWLFTPSSIQAPLSAAATSAANGEGVPGATTGTSAGDSSDGRLSAQERCYAMGTAVLLCAWLHDHVTLSATGEWALMQRFPLLDPSSSWWMPVPRSDAAETECLDEWASLAMRGAAQPWLDQLAAATLLAEATRTTATLKQQGQETHSRPATPSTPTPSCPCRFIIPPMPTATQQGKEENAAAPLPHPVMWHRWLWALCSVRQENHEGHHHNAKNNEDINMDENEANWAPYGSAWEVLHCFVDQLFQLSTAPGGDTSDAVLAFQRRIPVDDGVWRRLCEAQASLCYQSALAFTLSAVQEVLCAEAQLHRMQEQQDQEPDRDQSPPKKPSSREDEETVRRRMLRTAFARSAPLVFRSVVHATDAARIAASQWESTEAEQFLRQFLRPAVLGRCDMTATSSSSSSAPEWLSPRLFVHPAVELTSNTKRMAYANPGQPPIASATTTTTTTTQRRPTNTTTTTVLVATARIAEGELLVRETPLGMWQRHDLVPAHSPTSTATEANAKANPSPDSSTHGPPLKGGDSTSNTDDHPTHPSGGTPEASPTTTPAGQLMGQLLDLIREAETTLCRELAQGTVFLAPSADPDNDKEDDDDDDRGHGEKQAKAEEEPVNPYGPCLLGSSSTSRRSHHHHTNQQKGTSPPALPADASPSVTSRVADYFRLLSQLGDELGDSDRWTEGLSEMDLAQAALRFFAGAPHRATSIIGLDAFKIGLVSYERRDVMLPAPHQPPPPKPFSQQTPPQQATNAEKGTATTTTPAAAETAADAPRDFWSSALEHEAGKAGFYVTRFFSHSCAPNVLLVFPCKALPTEENMEDMNGSLAIHARDQRHAKDWFTAPVYTGEVVAVALRDIEPGEFLTVSYLPPSSLTFPRVEKQRLLGWECRCAWCTQKAVLLEGSLCFHCRQLLFDIATPSLPLSQPSAAAPSSTPDQHEEGCPMAGKSPESQRHLAADTLQRMQTALEHIYLAWEADEALEKPPLPPPTQKQAAKPASGVSSSTSPDTKPSCEGRRVEDTTSTATNTAAPADNALRRLIRRLLDLDAACDGTLPSTHFLRLRIRLEALATGTAAANLTLKESESLLALAAALLGDVELLLPANHVLATGLRMQYAFLRGRHITATQPPQHENGGHHHHQTAADGSGGGCCGGGGGCCGAMREEAALLHRPFLRDPVLRGCVIRCFQEHFVQMVGWDMERLNDQCRRRRRRPLHHSSSSSSEAAAGGAPPPEALSELLENCILSSFLRRFPVELLAVGVDSPSSFTMLSLLEEETAVAAAEEGEEEDGGVMMMDEAVPWSAMAPPQWHSDKDCAKEEDAAAAASCAGGSGGGGLRVERAPPPPNLRGDGDDVLPGDFFPPWYVDENPNCP